MTKHYLNLAKNVVKRKRFEEGGGAGDGSGDGGGSAGVGGNDSGAQGIGSGEGGGGGGGGENHADPAPATTQDTPAPESPKPKPDPILNFAFTHPDMTSIPSAPTFQLAAPPSGFKKGGLVRHGYAGDGAVSPMGDVYVSDQEEPKPTPDDDYNYVLSRLNGTNKPEEKPESKGMTLPSPSDVDTIRPSDPQGPKDYTDKWSAQLADKLGMSRENTRKLQEAAAVPAELLGFAPAYRAGSAGARGDYGEAAFEGANAALGMLPFVGAGEKAAVGAAKDVLTAPRAVARDVAGPSDMSRRSFLQGVAAAGTAAMLPEIKSAAPVVKEIAAPVAKAAPEAIAGAIDRVLATPLTVEHPLLAGKMDPDRLRLATYYNDPEYTLLDFFKGKDDGRLHTGQANRIEYGFNYKEDLNAIKNSAAEDVQSRVEKELGHPISDEEFKPILEKRAKHIEGVQNIEQDAMGLRHPERRGVYYEDVVDRFHGMIEDHLKSGEPIPLRSVKKHLSDITTPEFILKNMYGIEENEIPKFVEQYPRLLNTLTTDIKHSALYGGNSYPADTLRELVATPAPTKASEKAAKKAAPKLEAPTSAPQLDAAMNVAKNIMNAAEKLKTPKKTPKLEAPVDVPQLEAPVESDVTKKSGGVVSRAMAILHRK